ALRLDVLRMPSPGAHSFFRFELDHGDALAVVGEEALVRDIARHGGGELAHAVRQRHVFVPHAGHQAGAEDGHDHGTHPSNRVACCASSGAGINRMFAITAMRIVDGCRPGASAGLPPYSAAPSIAAMSSSERPKWWPISCTSTWLTMRPSF